MVLLTTEPGKIGSKAHDFNLLGIDKKIYNLDNVKGKNGLLVMFICNHCPYVQNIIDKLVTDTNELKTLGINAIAIMSNDITEYPEDSVENMKKLSEEKSFSFPYVVDDSQEVAKAYGAVCTPDFFGYNSKLELQYRGRLDSAGAKNTSNPDRELFKAMLEISKTNKGPELQHPSIGCSIKWK